MLNKAIRGIWKKKNSHDHKALKASCIKNKFLVFSNVI